MVYSYGLFGKNNRPYNEYYLNCGFRSVYSKNNNIERKDVDRMDLVYQLWENVKAEIKKNTSETIYSVWFNELSLESFDGESVVLTDDPFRCKIINEKFIPLLEECFEKIMGFKVSVSVMPKQDKPKKTEQTKEFKFSNTNNTTFENFIVGDSNKFAHAASLAVASDPGNTYNPLFIHGNSGLGKTHLLNAICNEILKNNPDAYIIYVRSEDFMNELIDYLQNKKDTSVFHNKYRNADVLLVDDVQFGSCHGQVGIVFPGLIKKLVIDIHINYIVFAKSCGNMTPPHLRVLLLLVTAVAMMRTVISWILTETLSGMPRDLKWRISWVCSSLQERKV